MRCSFVVTCLTLAVGVIAHSQPSATIVFEHVTVVPMTVNGLVLSDQTVVLAGDRITAIAPSDGVRVPDRAVRIDGRGKFLLPGLADMHVHLEYFQQPTVLAAFLYNGVTRIRNMDGRPYILDWRRKTAAGELVGPTIHTAGPLLDGEPPLRPENTVVRNPSEARAIVADQVRQGYDFIKVYGNLSADTYRSILVSAREHNRPVVGHVPRAITVEDVIASRQEAIEHLSDYDDAVEAETSPFKGKFHWSKPLLGMPFDAAMASVLARRLSEAGIWSVPTVVQADRSLAKADSMTGWLAEPEMRYIPADGHTIWREQMERSTKRMDEEDWKLVAQGRSNRLAMVRAMHAAGVRLLTGTDTPNAYLVPGFSLVHELENFVAAGLTPGETLAIATREAARFMRDVEASGTVESGKRADLVLLDANPLEAVGNVRRVAGVVVRGRWLPRAQIAKTLGPLQ